MKCSSSKDAFGRFGWVVVVFSFFFFFVAVVVMVELLFYLK